MALSKAVALAGGGIAAAIVILFALFIYKLVKPRKSEEGVVTRSAPHKAAHESPRPPPKKPEPRRESPARDDTPSRRPDAKDRTVVQMPPGPPPVPPRAAGGSGGARPAQSPFSGQPPVSRDRPHSGSADVVSTDDSVWQCPTWEATTGENWSIGTSNYVYHPEAFFISGDIQVGAVFQQGPAAENKSTEAPGGGAPVDEWGHRYDAVSSWVEDSKGGGWRPVEGDGGDDVAYSSRINNPLFNEGTGKAGGGQGRMVSSWVEDSAGGGWRPVDEPGRRAGSRPERRADPRDAGWKGVVKDDRQGCGPRGQPGGVDRAGRQTDSSQAGWRGVEREGLPSARQMGRVMDSWVEDSQGGGWRPVDKDGLPSARQLGRVMDSWVEDSQGGGWRPVDKGDLPSARQGGRVVDSWVEDSQGGGWRPVDEQEARGGAEGRRRPPAGDPNREAPRRGGGRQAMEIVLESEELPVSCSLPGDFDFIHRGSDDWDMESNMSNTVMPSYTLPTPTRPGGHGQRPKSRPTTPDLDSAVDLSCEQAPMERAMSLGESISSIEEGLPHDVNSQDPISINMVYTPSVPSRKPMPECRVGKPMAKPVPQCPEPMPVLSVSSAEDSDNEMMSPVMGQGRPVPAGWSQSPVIDMDVRQMPAREEKTFASPFFNTTNTSNSYFSQVDQVEGVEDGLSAYSLSSVDEIDLCVRSQEAVKRLDGSIWVDNALFDNASKAGQRGQGQGRGRARSPVLVSM